MDIEAPDFITKRQWTPAECRLLQHARAGTLCDLTDGEKADERFGELLKAEREKPEDKQRSHQILTNIATREIAAASEEATIRADLIRFLARGGNTHHPVDPRGVQLRGARIIEGPLNLEGCQNVRPLLLWACELAEKVMLQDASLQTLTLDGSRISSSDDDGDSLSADRLIAKGGVFLSNGFEARGTVSLLGADLGGNLACDGGRFGAEGVALDAESVRIGGGLIWRGLVAQSKGVIDLTAARVGTLVDDTKSWPEAGKLILDGFRYDRIIGPTGFEERRKWLEGQRPDQLTTDFCPQPFEQLATVLREMGHGEDAKEVAILKRQYQRRADFKNGTGWRRWFYCGVSHVFEKLVGFGYRPFRAFRTAILMIIIGALLFWSAERDRAMVPNNPFLLKTEWKEARLWERSYWRFEQLVPDYPPFHPLVYSIDTFVPLVNLHQEPHWIPHPKTSWGWVAQLYLWFHIAAGWVITALFAASLTGLVKKED